MNGDGASTSAGPQPEAREPAVDPEPLTERKSKRPKYSKFTQQELPACKPLLTPGWVITVFMVVGVIFIPIGAVTLSASNGVVEIVQRYEQECIPNSTTKEQRVNFIQDASADKTCQLSLKVPKKMKSPVYIYYQLDHFYQNHRRYVKSRDDEQLKADSVSSSSSASDSCKPEASLNGQQIVPCGLIAWSLFNDTYTFSSSGQDVVVNRHGISWKSDRDSKFGKVKPQNFANNLNGTTNTSLIGGAFLDPNVSLNEDEDLIVWMRTAALPTFRKLWGKIERDLVENEVISVIVLNNYNSYTYGGGKKLVLSTTSWLGGKNSFLGIAYLTVGVLCMFLAFSFFLLHLLKPRPLGDPNYLSWNKNRPIISSSTPQ